MDRRQFLFLGGALAAASPAWPAGGECLVAVATNFMRTAEALAPKFEAETGFRIILSGGSTGQLYAQILNGAPYDAFLAADQERPALLERAQLGHDRKTYARGLLTLWQPTGRLNEASLQGEFHHLAIANPALAPYGLAAKEALSAMGLWEPLQNRIVVGQNVAQAYALVASGNAELGLIARSFTTEGGAQWLVPEGYYQPILQDALLLSDNPAAAAFHEFLGSEPAQLAMQSAGYGAL